MLPIRWLLGWAFILILPSAALIERAAGWPGVGLYALGVVGVLVLWGGRVPRWLDERRALWATAALLGVLGLAVLVGYPLANAGVFGRGSDSDEALVLGVQALLAGRYPYAVRTYLGNPLSPLPGALFLAVPFVVLGVVAAQALWWLALWLSAVRMLSGDARRGLVALVGTLALCPAAWQGLVVGSDYAANAAYVGVAAVLATRARASWVRVLGALALGVALSSRATFLLVLIPLAVELARARGGWAAARMVVLTLGACVLVTVPFYVADPAGFTPLHTVGKLAWAESVMPHADVLVALSAGALAVGLAAWRWRAGVGDGLGVWRDAALVQAWPVVCGVVLASVKLQRLDFSFAIFGGLALWWGAFGFGAAGVSIEPIRGGEIRGGEAPARG